MSSVADYPVVIVTWDDAWAMLEEVDADLIHHNAQTFVSVGFLICSDKKGVTLACEYDRDTEGSLRSTMFIPRGMIATEVVVSDGPA